MALLGEAGAAQKTYQYFRFEPKRIQDDNTQIQLSEFTFSLNGTLLNLRSAATGPGRDGTETNIVQVGATFGTQDPAAAVGPNKLFDGKPQVSGGTPATRWLSPAGTALTTPLDINFTSQVTVDAYNFATGLDSASFPRTPVSWYFYGRNSTSAPWELIDARNNVAVVTTNNTYQAGFTIPDSVTPVVNYFRIQNTAAAGTAAIVRNDDANGVKLEWDASLGDTTITPPGNPVAQVGSATFDPPDNTTTTYTFAATRALPAPASTVTQSVQVRSVAGGTSNYRYLRFKATKLRNGTATGLVQLAEFGFLNNGSSVGVSAVTNPGGNSPANEMVANLIDSNTATKWLDTTNSSVVFDLGEPNPPIDENLVTHYYFVTANDAVDRDPLQWTLEGSNDETAWTLIENVNFDYPIPQTRFLNTRPIPLPGASLPPSIGSFFGDATAVYEGTPVKLSWNVVGAATISIDNGVGTVDPVANTVVTPPLGTTTYTLTAGSAGGAATSTRAFSITVVPGPAPTSIDFSDFASISNEMTLRGSSSFVSGRLQLTPDIGGRLGEAWHRVKQPVAEGFEATFGLSMTHAAGQPADGVSFIVQNHPEGSNAPSSGETGVASNALNICFITYGGTAADASRIAVRKGNEVLQTVSASNTAGITYKGITGYGYPTMTGMPGAEPFRIRVVYAPGDGVTTDSLLDVYVNEVAVIENLMVDLEDILAVDANGDAYVGFAGRTGGLSQMNEITYWKMRYGDFSALPPFGLVKAFKNTLNPAAPTWDLVWDSDYDNTYVVQSSLDLSPGSWEDLGSYLGEDGQIGVKLSILESEPRRLYRVVEEVPE